MATAVRLPSGTVPVHVLNGTTCGDMEVAWDYHRFIVRCVRHKLAVVTRPDGGAHALPYDLFRDHQLQPEFPMLDPPRHRSTP